MKKTDYDKMKILTLFLVFALFTATASAQAESATFGIAAGLNFSSLNAIETNPKVTFENRAGYHAGIFLDIGEGAVGIRPGVYYMNAGALFKGFSEGTSVPITDNFDVNFVTVTVDLRLRATNPSIQPYFFVGPALRFISSDAETSFKKNIKNINVSVSVGVGIQFNLVGFKLFPEVQYVSDQTGITKETIHVESANFPSFRTSGNQRVDILMLRVGLGF